MRPHIASSTAAISAAMAAMTSTSRWFLGFICPFLREGVGGGLGAAHRRIERKSEERRGQPDRDGIGPDDERPGAHALILRSRASTLVSASSARMRISTAAPNRQLKPTMVSGSGHSRLLSMLDPVTPMLCPW